MDSYEIYETAIACAFYRMQHQSISKDPIAKHVVNPKIQTWAELYKHEVSEAEDIAHCLRHRFFLEEITAFFKTQNHAVLINFGAGFSFYPFLVEGNHTFIEIDTKEIIEAKSKIIDQLQAKKLIPLKKITYLEGNLNQESSFPQLKKKISALVKNKPTFILIEGVIFYLNKEILPALFGLFSDVQQKGDILGAVSYVPQISETTAYKKLSAFFKNYLNISENNHTNLNPSYYENIKGYQLLKHVEYYKLYHTFVGKDSSYKEDEILNEHMYVLTKIN